MARQAWLLVPLSGRVMGASFDLLNSLMMTGDE